MVAGVVSLDLCIGADLFLRETFDGNGRSCATCHRVDDNFAIDLANVGLGDALRVLCEVSNLNATAKTAINTAHQRISEAQATSTEPARTSAITAARTALSGATPAIGTNIGYTIGAGTLMF